MIGAKIGQSPNSLEKIILDKVRLFLYE